MIKRVEFIFVGQNRYTMVYLYFKAFTWGNNFNLKLVVFKTKFNGF